MFDIFLTDEAEGQLNKLKTDKGLSKRYKAVKKNDSVFIPKPKIPGTENS